MMKLIVTLVRNCMVVGRDSLVWQQNADGSVSADLTNYAIVPLEEYDEMREAAQSHLLNASFDEVSPGETGH